METMTVFDRSHLAAFVERRWAPATPPLLSVRPLRGGLESPAVCEVRARFPGPGSRLRQEGFVVKLLEGQPVREAGVYLDLVARSAGDFAPALLDVEHLGPDRCLLFLERIRPINRWPWRDTAAARSLLKRLAWLHAVEPPDLAAAFLPSWDYEGELLDRAATSLAALENLSRAADLLSLRRFLPALRRTVERLPEMRRELLGFPPLGRAVLHGDVHPGNAMIRRKRMVNQPILLDWGRARIGSPLEDVASWLRSLGFWEPEARRRHDTLLATYLAARGLPAQADRSTREAYWIAAASNVLAGALLVHLRTAVSQAPGSPARTRAELAAHDALRVIRRVDFCWGIR
jgi:hypothetical protein